MKQLHFATRSQWRTWLTKNHAKEAQGIWLVFFRKETGKPTLSYGESVEEALCFGWIDSIIRKIDDERYWRKFTPRKPGSKWSEPNRKRVARMIAEQKMTKAGMALVEEAKASGRWQEDSRPKLSLKLHPEFAAALSKNKQARSFLESLAPSYRNQFIAWIEVAKRPETRARRIEESIKLLARGNKLGMK